MSTPFVHISFQFMLSLLGLKCQRQYSRPFVDRRFCYIFQSKLITPKGEHTTKACSLHMLYLKPPWSCMFTFVTEPPPNAYGTITSMCGINTLWVRFTLYSPMYENKTRYTPDDLLYSSGEVTPFRLRNVHLRFMQYRVLGSAVHLGHPHFTLTYISTLIFHPRKFHFFINQTLSIVLGSCMPHYRHNICHRIDTTYTLNTEPIHRFRVLR